LPTASRQPVIEFENVTKTFRLQEGNTLQEFLPALARGKGWTPPFRALHDLTFQVQAGETVGLIGRNGCGKSTTLKLVAGVMYPNSGKVTVRGRVCSLIELGAGFHPDLSGRENVYLNGSLLGLSDRDIRARYDEIVAFSELAEFMETPIKHYSSGMYIRLAFAVAVHCDPEILIVDEALGVGDIHFQEKGLVKMDEIKARGVAILLVSHNLDLIKTFCTRAILLDAGGLVADGAPEAIAERYLELMA
jgi:ABC-type polysaccharide/polyol phosphate transport system ATPase subunit